MTTKNIDGRELRDVFGKYATGIAVITYQQEGQPYQGMTINSFSSLSLEPALMLWSLQKNSDAYDAVMASPTFAVNILSKDQQPLSVQYSRKDEHDLLEQHYSVSDNGFALLNDSVATLECELETRHDGGDHIILIGRITAIAAGEGEPLLFFSGGYRELAVQ